MKSEISCLVWRLPAEFCRQVIYCIQTCLFRSSNLVLRFREETSNLMNAQQLNTSITLLCLLLTTFNNSIYKPAPNKLGTIFKTNTNHHSESTNFNLLHLHQPYSSQFFIDYQLFISCIQPQCSNLCVETVSVAVCVEAAIAVRTHLATALDLDSTTSERLYTVD